MARDLGIQTLPVRRPGRRAHGQVAGQVVDRVAREVQVVRAAQVAKRGAALERERVEVSVAPPLFAALGANVGHGRAVGRKGGVAFGAIGRL